VFCTIHPQFGTHMPVHDYEMYIIYIFRFTNQCNIWGNSGSISVYCMLYALMLHSGASVAAYLLMLYTCIHTQTHTRTHSFSQQSRKFNLIHILHVYADSTSV
jgi:hypothetical protein